jgi:predicted regulator of Ras-like GTPase activity (Roadblock/LC7/MglB family)
VRATADLLLAALGTDDAEDADQYARAVAGAMALAEGLLELTRLRKMLARALKG